MRFTIYNCSSPGASFTDNTNNVMIKFYQYAQENIDNVGPFVDFRKGAAKSKQFNDNNARNILPLIKNFGLVKYEKGGIIRYSDFFTRDGLAYITALETRSKIIDCADYSENQRKQAVAKIDVVLERILLQGLIRALKQPDNNYKDVFIALLKCFVRFNKMCKEEFAYFLYEYDISSKNLLENMQKNIIDYRKGLTSFE